MTLPVERARFGREPYFIAELSLPQCQQTFGSSPCTGTGEPCYKTLANCKSVVSAYSPSNVSYRFASIRNPVPTGFPQTWTGGVIPCLDSVEITPARIGANGNLGQRGVVTLKFIDTTHNDRGFDPHVASRTYDPMTRGTLFGRLRARHPYYNNRVLTLRIGYLTEAGVYDSTNFRTYTYFIESFEGPDANGVFTITAKDLLKQLDDKRAVCPPPSQGKLLAAITDVQTTAALTPAGIGNAQYPASGMIDVGGELMLFTRVADALTITRAHNSTKAIAHEANEAVQLCKVYTASAVQNILYDLEVNHASVPTTYIPKAEWDAEQVSYLPRLYSAIIAQPTPVKQLVGELLELTGTQHWWDEEFSLLRFKATHALDATVPVKSLGENSHLLQDSVSIKEDHEKRLTQVWVYHGIIDPTKDLTDANNYRLLHIETDPNAESAEMYGDKRVRTIYSRWITSTNTAAAIDLAQTLLKRFRRTPRSVTFSLDEKDTLRQGDFVQLATDRVQRADGSSEPINAQVLSRKHVKLATQSSYSGVEFLYLEPQTGPSGAIERLIVIAAPTDVNIAGFYGNLRTLHDSVYAAPTAGDVVRFRIITGAGFYSSTPVDPAAVVGSNYGAVRCMIKTGGWPANVKVYIDFEADSWAMGTPGRGAYFAAFTQTAVPGVEGQGTLYIDPSLNPTTCFVKVDGLLMGGCGGGGALLRGPTGPLDPSLPANSFALAGGGGSNRLGPAAGGGVSWLKAASNYTFNPGPPIEGYGTITNAFNGQVLTATQVYPDVGAPATFYYGRGGSQIVNYDMGVPGFTTPPLVQFTPWHNYKSGNTPATGVLGGEGGMPAANRVAGQWPVIRIARQDGLLGNPVVVQTVTPTADGYQSLQVADGPVYANTYFRVGAPGAAGTPIYGSANCTITGANAAALVAGQFGTLVP